MQSGNVEFDLDMDIIMNDAEVDREDQLNAKLLQ